MSRITRRHASVLLAATAATACGPKPGGEPQAGTTPAQPQVTDPRTVDVALDASEQEMVDVLSAEFEVDPTWNLGADNVTPADVSEEIMRSDRGKAVAKTFADIRGGKTFFVWAKDEDSVDLHHIVAEGASLAIPGGQTSLAMDTAPFELTGKTLRAMAEANYFQIAHDPKVPADKQRVIFGLRGCEIERASKKLEPSVMLREATPDHRKYKCVIGVWNPGTDEVAAFRSSTVPLEVHLALYQTWFLLNPRPAGKWNACMVPQGLHRRRVGTMAMGSGTICPLTLRQDVEAPVLREPNHEANTLSVNSVWDPDSPGDRVANVGAHIHAGINKRDDLQFSSQGCQTIDGWYENGVPKKDIADFNVAMAFEKIEPKGSAFASKSDGNTYPFMLLSGREARLHAVQADPVKLKRLRFGSSAPADAGADHPVKQLQAKLEVPVTGVFNSVTMLKLIERQRLGANTGLKADGVVGPASASQLGVVFT